MLGWRAQVLTAGLFFSLLMVPFYLFSQKELAPIEDQSSINIVVDAPSSASLEYTNSYMHDVIATVLGIPGVRYVWQECVLALAQQFRRKPGAARRMSDRGGAPRIPRRQNELGPPRPRRQLRQRPQQPALLTGLGAGR